MYLNNLKLKIIYWNYNTKLESLIKIANEIEAFKDNLKRKEDFEIEMDKDLLINLVDFESIKNKFII